MPTRRVEKPPALPVRRPDALQELAAFTGEDVHDWSQDDITATVAGLVRASEHLARVLTNAAESMGLEYTLEYPATPKDVRDMAGALQATSLAIEKYTAVHDWAQREGKTGAVPPTTLEDLLPHLTDDELTQLRRWLLRLAPPADRLPS